MKTETTTPGITSPAIMGKARNIIEIKLCLHTAVGSLPNQNPAVLILWTRLKISTVEIKTQLILEWIKWITKLEKIMIILEIFN